MVYIKKNIKNALKTLLQGSVSNSDTLFTITTGEGAMFPTNLTPLVVEQFNSSGACFKREVINLTGKTGDILQVARAYEPCVQDDTASPKTITQNALSFDLDQGVVKISQYNTAKIQDDIQDELIRIVDEDITDLENTKKNKDTTQTITGNYTFVGTEKSNLETNCVTTAGNITIDLDLSLFPTTNGFYEFSFYKSTNDANTVTIDVGAGSTIDGAQTYVISNYMETVTLAIVSGTFAKSVSSTNRTSALPLIKSTQELFVAGENITAGNALYVSGSNVFKTNASNSSQINFIGFATNTATTGNNVIVDTSGVSATQSGLTVNTNYYLSNTPGAISTTPGTNIVSVGKAVESGILINNADKYNRDNYTLVGDTQTFTKYLNSPTGGNVVYNHGLGRIPSTIIFNAKTNWNGWMSDGSYSRKTNSNKCAYLTGNGSGLLDNAYSIVATNSSWSSYHKGRVTSVTSTTFTITWDYANGYLTDQNYNICATLIA